MPDPPCIERVDIKYSAQAGCTQMTEKLFPLLQTIPIESRFSTAHVVALSKRTVRMQARITAIKGLSSMHAECSQSESESHGALSLFHQGRSGDHQQANMLENYQ